MEVTPLSSFAPSAQAEPTSAASLDYNAFLRLLIAQMQNQDPLNPMEGTEYTAQLAQFSSVEQSIQTNQKLDSLMTSFSLSQAESMIGRTLTSADGKVSGVVEAVNILSSGSIAQLQDGQRVPLGAGITIS
ncbi:MAG: flagellar hook assembly protein FlgD [Rhizobiales bacterium]|nr:flagellar hook assembly protein FlgD [Hyphomicrobiales bacterium]